MRNSMIAARRAAAPPRKPARIPRCATTDGAKRAVGRGQRGEIRVLQGGADDPAGEAALLVHADRAVHRVVEDQDDRPGAFDSAVASSCPVIMKPPSPQNPTTIRSGWTSLAATAAGHAIAHRAAGRPELPSGPAVLQKAVGPAAEIAGVGGDDRVVGQALAQPHHDLAEIERRPLGRQSARARPRIRRAPPRASRPARRRDRRRAPRRRRRIPACRIGSRRVGRNTRPNSSAAAWTWISVLPGSGMPSSV